MKIAGIVLILAQIVSMFPMLITGEDLSGHTFAWFLGRFSFGIVGVILLILSRKKRKREAKKERT